MIVTFEIGNDVEIKIENDSKGKISKIVFTPEFGSAKDVVTLATCVATTSGGRELDSFTLKVSGRNGRVSRKPRGGVTAFVDQDPPRDVPKKLDEPLAKPQQKRPADARQGA